MPQNSNEHEVGGLYEMVGKFQLNGLVGTLGAAATTAMGAAALGHSSSYFNETVEGTSVYFFVSMAVESCMHRPLVVLRDNAWRTLAFGVTLASLAAGTGSMLNDKENEHSQNATAAGAVGTVIVGGVALTCYAAKMAWDKYKASQASTYSTISANGNIQDDLELNSTLTNQTNYQGNNKL